MSEYATRNLGHVINYGNGVEDTTYNCSYFINNVDGANATLIKSVCDKYDFSSLADVRFFVLSDWYNQKTEFMNATGLNEAQTTSLFDPLTPFSFGALLRQVMGAEQVAWNCDTFNCTSSDLVWRQYGASELTSNPIYPEGDDKYFIPTSYSIYNWGEGQETPGVRGPPEVSAYLNYPYHNIMSPFSLNVTQIEHLLSESYSWYGMGNNYNMMKLYSEWANSLSQGDAPSTYWSTAAASFGLSEANLAYILSAYEWQVTQLLFEGLT